MTKKKIKKAVALKYTPGKDVAPKVTAKGKGEVAKAIIKMAKKHNVPIKDDPDLVEVLSKIDINKEVPPEVYVAVAELLAFVYSTNRKKKSL